MNENNPLNADPTVSATSERTADNFVYAVRKKEMHRWQNPHLPTVKGKPLWLEEKLLCDE